MSRKSQWSFLDSIVSLARYDDFDHASTLLVVLNLQMREDLTSDQPSRLDEASAALASASKRIEALMLMADRDGSSNINRISNLARISGVLCFSKDMIDKVRLEVEEDLLGKCAESQEFNELIDHLDANARGIVNARTPSGELVIAGLDGEHLLVVQKSRTPREFKSETDHPFALLAAYDPMVLIEPAGYVDVLGEFATPGEAIKAVAERMGAISNPEAAAAP